MTIMVHFYTCPDFGKRRVMSGDLYQGSKWLSLIVKEMLLRRFRVWEIRITERTGQIF